MKKKLEEKIDSLQSENLELERRSERLKSTLQDYKDKMQANTRAMEILAEVLEEIPEEEKEDLLPHAGIRVDTKMMVLEAMRSHANETMKISQVVEAIKQKHPSFPLDGKAIWYHLNKTLAFAGLVKKVSPGVYQYEFAKKELREDDCFAVGGD